MKQLKIGNKIKKLVIRTHSSVPLNKSYQPQYDNQPYTILSDVEADFNFSELDKTKKTTSNVFNYNNYYLDSFVIKNVPLTDKIMNLLFEEDSNLSGTYVENVLSDSSGHIFLKEISDDQQIDTIFLFDSDQKVTALELLKPEEIIVEPNKNYLAVYDVKNYKGWLFNKPSNVYTNIDMQVISNEGDSTQKYFIHADKCSLKVEHSLHFNRDLSSVDLKIIVLGSSWIAQREQ